MIVPIVSVWLLMSDSTCPSMQPKPWGKPHIQSPQLSGCPYTFCAVTNVANGRWLADKSDAVLESIGVLVESYGADAIEFHDNNFLQLKTTEKCKRID